MKKLIAIPTFDKKGILNGMEVIDCIYLPDEVTIDGETIKMPGSEISELSERPRIVFDVRDVEEFINAEIPKPSPTVIESSIVRAGRFLRDKLSGY